MQVIKQSGDWEGDRGRCVGSGGGVAGAGLRVGVTLTHSAAAYLAAGHTAYTPPSLPRSLPISQVTEFPE